MKTTNQIDREANEQKAKEICDCDNCKACSKFAEEGAAYAFISTCDRFNELVQAMKWKDKERKELWRITRNHYQEWAIEQLTAFAQHLNKRGAFRDDLCMDFEHEAQSFIEMQNNKEL